MTESKTQRQSGQDRVNSQTDIKMLNHIYSRNNDTVDGSQDLVLTTTTNDEV